MNNWVNLVGRDCFLEEKIWEGEKSSNSGVQWAFTVVKVNPIEQVDIQFLPIEQEISSANHTSCRTTYEKRRGHADRLLKGLSSGC